MPFAIVSDGSSIASESSLSTIRCWIGRSSASRRRRGAIELLGELATIADEDGAGDGLEQHALAVRQTIAANQEDAARTVFPRAPRPTVDERREMLLHLVEIADRMLVQKDDVGLQTLKRQYSCACSTCRTSARSSSSTTLTSRIGRSPDTP